MFERCFSEHESKWMTTNDFCGGENSNLGNVFVLIEIEVFEIKKMQL